MGINYVGSIFQVMVERVENIPGETWQWFNTLNREEWLVVLTVVCACGFVAMLGFRSSRL